LVTLPPAQGLKVVSGTHDSEKRFLRGVPDCFEGSRWLAKRVNVTPVVQVSVPRLIDRCLGHRGGQVPIRSLLGHLRGGPFSRFVEVLEIWSVETLGYCGLEKALIENFLLIKRRLEVYRLA